ncbi:unnamed protein product, partial [Sphacelaria rigidula]
MLLLDARHGFKKKDIEFLELLYDPKGPSPLGEYALHALDHNFWHLMGHPEIRALILKHGKYKPPKIQIVLTKCDLVKRLDLARRVTMVRRQLDE